MFFSLGVLKYVVSLCKGCDGCCVFGLYCGAVGARVGVRAFRHADIILHDLQFVNNAGWGCKKRPYGRGILQSRSHDYLVGIHECLIMLPHLVAVSSFIFLFKKKYFMHIMVYNAHNYLKNKIIG